MVLLSAIVLAPISRGASLEFVTGRNLPWAVAYREYRVDALKVRSYGTCPAGGVGYQIVSGELPTGMHLSTAGFLSGTPAERGIFTFVVRAMNGCAWGQQRFALAVTRPPVLSATPARVVLHWKDDPSPVATLRIESSWPDFAYSVRADADWLEARAQRGITTSEARIVFEDVVELRVHLPERKPGRYKTLLQFSAWQMEPMSVPVELVIDADSVPVEAAPTVRENPPAVVTHPEVSQSVGSR